MPAYKFRVPELSGVSAANSLGKSGTTKKTYIKREMNSRRVKAQKCKITRPYQINLMYQQADQQFISVY